MSATQQCYLIWKHIKIVLGGKTRAFISLTSSFRLLFASFSSIQSAELWINSRDKRNSRFGLLNLINQDSLGHKNCSSNRGRILKCTPCNLTWIYHSRCEQVFIFSRHCIVPEFPFISKKLLHNHWSVNTSIGSYWRCRYKKCLRGPIKA